MASPAAKLSRTKPYRARKPILMDGTDDAITDVDPTELPPQGFGDMGEPEEMPDGGMEVPLDGQPPKDIGGATMTESDDGTAIVDFSPQGQSGEEPEFDANLAEHLDDSVLNDIAEQVLTSTEEDKKSRADWESMMAEGINQLGLKIEDREWPFAGASGVWDTLMMEAVTRDQAMTMAELLPAGGPVKTQIIGTSSDELEAQAGRVKEWFNFYLTEGAPEYYDDRDQMFMWRALVGSVFTKTYFDPILGRPVSPFITPDNFIVSFTTSHLNTSPRYTHIIPMNPREMRLRQLSGFYRDIDLGKQMPQDLSPSESDAIRQATLRAEGRSSTDYEKDTMFFVHEQHVDMEIPGFEHKDKNGKETNLPVPYIISVDRESRKVLSIRRNWRKDDPICKKIQYFTHYKFLPGLGFYGYGYAHILGNPAKAATSLQRQIIDAATLNMFPGGLTNAQMKTGDNNVNIGPCEFRYVETGGEPIQNAIMPMPYKEPSAVSLALLDKVRENARNLANAQEIAVGEGRQDAPVGTTVALLEAATRVQAANIKRAHRAMRQEFKLFAALFAQYLPETPYPYLVQSNPNGKPPIMREDFSNRIDVIPVSDPNITSSAQRIMRAEAYLRLASQFPDIYDKYEANKNMLIEMGTDEAKIPRLLPPQAQAQSADPLSENQMVLGGKPVTAQNWQDHDSHIAVHQALQEVPAMQAHIAMHVGMKMRQQVQQQIGKPLPPLGQKMPPQLENQIAFMTAQAVKQIATDKGQDLSPERIAWEQTQVEAQGIMAKIDDSKRRQETEAYKANIASQDKQKELDTQLEIERLRNIAKIHDQTLRAKADAAKSQGKDN